MLGPVPPATTEHLKQRRRIAEALDARLKLNATSRLHAAVKAAAGQLIEP